MKIVNEVNGYNNTFESATRVFNSDITTIRDHIQQLLVLESLQEKEKAFEAARRELETDLQALAMLIKPQEEMAV